MEQYIPKSTLVAEIERLKENANKRGAIGKVSTIVLCNELLSFINTLEVKDVDLEKEIDRVWDNTSDNFSEDGWKEFEDIAQYFFELGLKAQKRE